MKQRTIVSVSMTLVVVFMLVLSAPVHAVVLSTTLPETGSAGSAVTFYLKTDIEAGENVPIDNVTLLVNGPSGQETCVFAPDGTPISGCEDLKVSLLQDESDYTLADRYGAGWNGTADVNTSFGNGYGYGFAPEKLELVWQVTWNTGDALPGEYTVDFFVSSASSEASRVYRLKAADKLTLTGASTCDEGRKVEICHKTGQRERTIAVSECSVQDHLGHGDTLGACETPASTPVKEPTAPVSTPAKEKAK